MDPGTVLGLIISYTAGLESIQTPSVLADFVLSILFQMHCVYFLGHQSNPTYQTENFF